MSEFASGFFFCILLVVILAVGVILAGMYEDWRGPVGKALHHARKEGFRKICVHAGQKSFSGVAVDKGCYYYWRYGCSGVKNGERVNFILHFHTYDDDCRLEILEPPVAVYVKR
jgi:hypothetical protein